MGYVTEPAQKTEVCWYGYAEDGKGGYVFDTDAKYYPALGNDPRKDKTREERIVIAKDLLAQAGWTDQNGDGIVESKGVAGIDDGTKFSVTLDYESTWAAAECHSLLMSEWAKEAGMEVIANSYDGATFWSDAIAGKHQMWHLGLSLTQLPWERFRMAFHSKGEWTSYITHVNDPELDKMIDDAIAATNMDDKLAKTKIAHDYLVDQQYITNDGAQDMGWITNAKLEGFYASPQSLMWTRSIIISDIADR
jgi:ABC-type transport system substrate-binding protein